MAIEVTRQFDMAIRWSVHFENLMVSVQRLQEFARLEPESLPDELEAKRKLAEKSSDKGLIEFKRVEMSYKPNLKPALRQVSFAVEPGMRVAIVGRPGAGKSSIF